MLRVVCLGFGLGVMIYGLLMISVGWCDWWFWFGRILVDCAGLCCALWVFLLLVVVSDWLVGLVWGLQIGTLYVVYCW